MTAPRAPTKAVLFDLGNVLVDWNPRHLYRKIFSDESAMERFLAETCTMEWHGASDAGLDMAENAARLIAEFPGLAIEIRAWRERWDEMFAGPITGAVAVMERLDDAGIPVYALTNLPAEKKAHLMETFSFMTRFGDIVVTGEEGVLKPDRAIFEIAARRVGAEPGAVLFIDDRDENVAAARQFGFDAELFTGAPALEAAVVARGLITAPAVRSAS